MKPERLQIDYIAPSRRRVLLGWLVLVLSVGVAGDTMLRYRDAHRALERLETASALLAPDRRPAKPLPKERLDEESRSAEAVVRQLTLPWASLVRSIEQAASSEVAVLQLQPDADNRVIRLTAEARHRSAMFDYLRRLDASKELSELHVVSHQVQRESRLRPIQFTVQAELKVPR